MTLEFVVSRKLFFLVAMVLIMAAALLYGYIYLPKALIHVYPAVLTRPVEQEILLSTGITEPDFVRFILPAKIVNQPVTESRTVRRADSNTFDDYAKGEVIMVNEQDEDQSLVVKTHLLYEPTGIYFLTDGPVKIPAGGKVKVKVTAEEKGAAGNIEPTRLIIDRLPREVQSKIYAESDTTFTGGLAVSNAITQEEINKAKENVKILAEEKALGELTLALGGASVRKELITKEILSETVSAEPGSKAVEFTVQMEMKVRAFVVDENDLLSLTLLALRSQVDADKEFVEYEPESFALEVMRSDAERGEARIKGSLTGLFARKIGPAIFETENLAGRTQDEVYEYFGQFEQIGSVEVAFSPFWVKAVPTRKDATEIVIGSSE